MKKSHWRELSIWLKIILVLAAATVINFVVAFLGHKARLFWYMTAAEVMLLILFIMNWAQEELFWRNKKDGNEPPSE